MQVLKGLELRSIMCVKWSDIDQISKNKIRKGRYTKLPSEVKNGIDILCEYHAVDGKIEMANIL